MTSSPLPEAGVVARPGIVESLLGANATRHILHLLDGQYLYQYHSEDSSVRYKFLSAQSVRLAFSNEPVDSGWLPPGLQRWGYGSSGQWAVLFVPPGHHRLWLPPATLSHQSQGNGEAETAAAAAAARDGLVTPVAGETLDPPTTTALDEPLPVEIPLPGLVFAGIGQHYYLWAIKEREFNPQASVYHAPLPNVYPDSSICWGTNRVESVTPSYLTVAWQLFIGSPFNSHLCVGKSRRHPQNVLKTLGHLARPDGTGHPLTNTNTGSGSGSDPKARGRSYPLRDLQPLAPGWERNGLTVEALVERLTHERRS